MVKEVVVEVVELMKDEYSIKEICILIGIPRSTYYRWKNKEKDVKEAKLEQAILTICMTNHFRYGHRKVTALLKRKYNYHPNRKTVQKIMQKKNLQCRVKRKRRTWINGESRIVVENLLNRNFQANKPNEKWVTDITYLPFGTEMLYLLSIMDLYNNEIIAYEISNRQDVTLVLRTVEKAIKLQQKTQIILHSDQGAVYTSYAFQTLSKKNGITTSMSRKG
ncbi:TPA: IS3 family transposase, partial [Bacillus anthracis]|nr:IS3 family transposase [Bacillus anthracis]